MEWHLALLGILWGQIVLGKPGAELSLELVQVLFRHGARTPTDCEARFIPNASDAWYEPYGYSQLTKEGMLEEYEIGRMLRKRYDGFLPERYRAKDVYAYSSNFDRTKASAQLVLAALYAPTRDLAWHKDLDWLPVPVNWNPRRLDVLMNPRICPKFKKTLRSLYDSDEFKKAKVEHDDIVKKISVVYGENFEFRHVQCAYQAVVAQKNLNLSLPSWYSDDDYDKLFRATMFHLDSLSHTPELRRLNGGQLTRRFVENINSSVKGRKIYLYCGHEMTLYSFIRANDVTFTSLPDYGSAIIMETLKDHKNKLYVKMLLSNGTPKQLTTLKLGNCSEVCPMEEYLKIVAPVLPSDDEMRCLYKDLKPEDIDKILNMNFST